MNVNAFHVVLLLNAPKDMTFVSQRHVYCERVGAEVVDADRFVLDALDDSHSLVVAETYKLDEDKYFIKNAATVADSRNRKDYTQLMYKARKNDTSALLALNCS